METARATHWAGRAFGHDAEKEEKDEDKREDSVAPGDETTLLEVIRENPVPAALSALGLASLVLSARRPDTVGAIARVLVLGAAVLAVGATAGLVLLERALAPGILGETGGPPAKRS